MSTIDPQEFKAEIEKLSASQRLLKHQFHGRDRTASWQSNVANLRFRLRMLYLCYALSRQVPYTALERKANEQVRPAALCHMTGLPREVVVSWLARPTS